MLSLIKEKWNDILEQMKIENDISEVAFTTWVKYFKPYKVEGNMITVSIEKKNLVLDTNWFSKKYRMPLIITIAEVLETEFDVQFVIPDTTEKININESSADSNGSALINTHLNPRYTFDTFVVGKNNDIAHATALAVAEDPGIYGNPLFIYGGAGLGKTHLLHSIAHYALSKSPDYRIIYVTSEEFTNELVHSIQHKQIERFKNKYRNIDMLLIDDIQFIVNKESTQEEFFHTFTSLYESKKQIVISSDKPPKDMEILDERFRSRFEWGLIVDITLPDYETRMAILHKKEDMDGYNVSEDVIKYIANNIKSNIRELEGAFNKVVAYAKLEKKEVTLELAEQALKDIVAPNENKQITADYIISMVAEHFNVSTADLCGNKRSSKIVMPRQVAMYLCREILAIPLKNVGQYLGNRDHTTVMHGVEKIEKELQANEQLQSTIDTLKKKINPQT